MIWQNQTIMRRRSQLIPWKVAGRVSERHLSGDDVVRETGWVFNNEIGDDLTLAEFVATGDDEVPAYLEAFGLREDANAERTMIEIGSGIGRMTVAFTREFGSVIAADLAGVRVPTRTTGMGLTVPPGDAEALADAIERCNAALTDAAGNA